MKIIDRHSIVIILLYLMSIVTALSSQEEPYIYVQPLYTLFFIRNRLATKFVSLKIICIEYVTNDIFKYE